MNNKEKILKLLDKNGYITTEQLKNMNINRFYLSELVKENKINRVCRGYYTKTDGFADNFYLKLSKCKKAIFSDATALYFYDLSDRNPIIYDIAVPYGYGNNYKNDKNVILHYINPENLELGLTYVESPFGMKIRVYDKERTICDIIKNRKKMEPEIFVKALQRYSKTSDKNLSKLMRYAKKLNIDKKVREYMEILL